MNRLAIIASIAAFGLSACQKGQDQAQADSTARDLTLAPTESTTSMQDVPDRQASPPAAPRTTPPAARPPAARPPAIQAWWPARLDPVQLVVRRRPVSGTILMTRPLCDENCRGLCSGCGVNLNDEDCVCAAPAVDRRMAIFQTIKIGR